MYQQLNYKLNKFVFKETIADEFFLVENLLEWNQVNSTIISYQLICEKWNNVRKIIAPGEARTHDLRIMRPTRCLLRYRGLW